MSTSEVCSKKELAFWFGPLLEFKQALPPTLEKTLGQGKEDRCLSGVLLFGRWATSSVKYTNRLLFLVKYVCVCVWVRVGQGVPVYVFRGVGEGRDVSVCVCACVRVCVCERVCV